MINVFSPSIEVTNGGTLHSQSIHQHNGRLFNLTTHLIHLKQYNKTRDEYQRQATITRYILKLIINKVLAVTYILK